MPFYPIDLKLSVTSENHRDYDLSVPVTYVISFQSADTNLKMWYRFALTEAWTQFTEYTTTDYFNNVNAVRFFYAEKMAFVSIGFAGYSNDIYLRLTNNNDVPIWFVFTGQCTYYDFRRAVVTSSEDDPQLNDISYFQGWADAHISRGIPGTVCVVTFNDLDGDTVGDQAAPWSDIQAKIDAPNSLIEVACHSRQHIAWIQGANESSVEYTSARDDILEHLNLEPAGNTSLYTSVSASLAVPVSINDTSITVNAANLGFIVGQRIRIYDPTQTPDRVSYQVAGVWHDFQCITTHVAAAGATPGTKPGNFYWKDLGAAHTYATWDVGHGTYHAYQEKNEVASVTGAVIGLSTPARGNYTTGGLVKVQFVPAYIEPWGKQTLQGLATAKAALYVVSRSGDAPSCGTMEQEQFPPWSSSNDFYKRMGFTHEMGIEAYPFDAISDATILNANFDEAYDQGRIFHLFCHAYQVDWATPAPYVTSHMDHIAYSDGVTHRYDVWYTGYGALSQYHYITENISVLQFVTAAVSLTGVGSLSATATVIKVATVTLTGTGSLQAQADIVNDAAVAFAGVGSLQAQATVVKVVTATLTGVGSLSATATVESSGPLIAYATMTGVGSLTALANITIYPNTGQGNVTSYGELQGLEGKYYQVVGGGINDIYSVIATMVGKSVGGYVSMIGGVPFDLKWPLRRRRRINA